MAYEKQKLESYQLMGGINNKISLYNNGPQEFRDLANVNFVSIDSLTKRPGSTGFVGASVAGFITGGTEFTRLSGASYLVVTANTNAYVASILGFNPFKTGLQNNALFSFQTFVDRLFAANGNDFFKFDGTNSTAYSLPPGITGSWGVTAVVGGGLSGIYIAGYGYLNDRGYLGPVSNGITISLNGITFGTIDYYGLTALTGYGITAIALYRSNPGFLDMFGTTYAPAGATTVNDTGFSLITTAANFNLWFTMAPRYLEIFNNQLMMAGFSSMPSTLWWSQVGEPEGVDPTFFNEFRTNDGDVITGVKSYGGNIVVTKERSFHAVSGTDPDNFSFAQLSDEYGCISDRAMIVYENILWFLDTKGICQYNGANIGIISEKVEGIFTSMNLVAARQNASAVHFKQFNEVWFSIPINGSTVNNVTVVYDYVARAWTKYDGTNPSVNFLAFGNQPKLTVFFGGYSGTLSYFGASFLGDSGRAITCMINSAYLAPLGETITKQFRRFYMNLDAINGSSQVIDVEFTTNFDNSTINATGLIFQTPFQTRLDFGIPAKSINFTAHHVSASLPFRLNGFAFEARFQRNT